MGMQLNEFLPRCEKALRELNALKNIKEHENNKTEVVRLTAKIEGLQLAISWFKEIDFCQEYNICWKEGE